MNYCATAALLELATQRLPRLLAFTHVSSVWAYSDEPPGATVAEEVKGLALPGGQAVQHAQLAAQLLEPAGGEGDRLAAQLVRHWGFPDAYCLTKRLAELLVQEESRRARASSSGSRCAFALVRPSLIGAVAGAPYPGYCLGNVHGATGERSARAGEPPRRGSGAALPSTGPSWQVPQPTCWPAN